MKPETRKQEIIRTAAKLFKERGYSAVTMRDLAASMGIKAASLYNHISSKQELLKEIIIDIAEEFTRGMKRIRSSDFGTLEKLRDIIALHVQITSQNTDGMASLNNDWMHLEEQLDYYLELRHKYETNFREIINEGIEQGDLKNENPEIILFSILTTLRSLYLWIPKKEDLNPDELALNLCEILIEGINS